MSSKKGTSSSSKSSGSGNNKQAKSGTEYVKKKLGLVEKKAGPMDYLQKGKTTGVYASKLHGTKGGMDFYGQEASAATNEYLESIGEAQKGKQYADGSWSYILTSKGKELKYGKSSGAMGSGDKSGIMGSIPISQPMHKSQQKLQGILMGGLSLALPGVAGTAMRGMALSSFSKMGREGYSDYLTEFYSGKKTTEKLSGGKVEGNEGSGEVSSSGLINTSVTGENTELTKFKKKKAGQGADTVASDRSLLATSTKTITGYMA